MPRSNSQLCAPAAGSAIAESGSRGTGLYPHTVLGVGFVYAIARSRRAALAVGGEVHPPASLYAANPAQASFALDVASTYRVWDGLALEGSLTVAIARRADYQRLLPTIDVGVAIGIADRTDFTADIGSRRIARFGRTQPCRGDRSRDVVYAVARC